MSNDEESEKEQESGLIFIQGLNRSTIERLILDVSDYKAEKIKEDKRSVEYKIGPTAEVTIRKINWNKVGPLDKVTKPKSGFDIPHIGSGGGEELIVIAIILLIILTYAVALLAVWIVGTIFTLGKYRQRVMKYIIEIKFVDKQKAKTFANNLIERLLKNGTRVKTYNLDIDDSAISTKMNTLEHNYSIFNKGENILKGAIIYFSVFEIPRYILEHYYSYHIASEIQWFLWRYPSLVMGLIGLSIMLIGELRIRHSTW